MKTVAEALNTLISAVNVAHNKGGVYSLEEAHYIHTAISYLNNLQQAQESTESQESAVEPIVNEEYQGSPESTQKY